MVWVAATRTKLWQKLDMPPQRREIQLQLPLDSNSKADTLRVHGLMDSFQWQCSSSLLDRAQSIKVVNTIAKIILWEVPGRYPKATADLQVEAAADRDSGRLLRAIQGTVSLAECSQLA